MDGSKALVYWLIGLLVKITHLFLAHYQLTNKLINRLTLTHGNQKN